MDAKSTYEGLTAKGQALMTQIGTWKGSFFDDGIVEGSGAWGEVLAGELDLTAIGAKSVKSVAGILVGTKKAGLWNVTKAETGDDSDFWSLTALGAEVARYAASLVAPATPTEHKIKWFALLENGSIVATSKRVSKTWSASCVCCDWQSSFGSESFVSAEVKAHKG
jgi:hypothetical protein